jgi:hypothetical protein
VKRIVQSRTGEDGTCFRACLASILEVPESRVPDFGAGGDDDRWWADIQAWLRQAGLEYVRTPIGGTKPVGWSTIEGISPRGGLHACVAKDGELVHDPHPQDGTGRGLVEPRYYGVFRKVGGKAKDAGYTCPECGAAVERRYKNSTCQKCLEKAHQEYLVKSRAAKAKLDASRDTPGYKTALAEFRAGGFHKKGWAKDRADMMELRRKTDREGGPFHIQETTKSGRERTIPVRELSKGADVERKPETRSEAQRRNYELTEAIRKLKKLNEPDESVEPAPPPFKKPVGDSSMTFAMLLAAMYAWYKAHSEAAPVNYDLTTYVPKKRSFDKEEKRNK